MSKVEGLPLKNVTMTLTLTESSKSYDEINLPAYEKLVRNKKLIHKWGLIVYCEFGIKYVNVVYRNKIFFFSECQC